MGVTILPQLAGERHPRDVGAKRLALYNSLARGLIPRTYAAESESIWAPTVIFLRGVGLGVGVRVFGSRDSWRTGSNRS